MFAKVTFNAAMSACVRGAVALVDEAFPAGLQASLALELLTEMQAQLLLEFSFLGRIWCWKRTR